MFKTKKSLITTAALAIMITLSGCSKGAWNDLERNPPNRGLLHEIRTSGMKDASSNGYTVQVKATDGDISIDQNETLVLEVKDSKGQVVKQFTEDMTKLFHFIIVSRDLSKFAHIHPELKDDGTFEVEHQFPFGGDFLLISEFIPAGKELTVHKQWLSVPEPTSRKSEPVVPDSSLTKTIDGIEVTLTMMPSLEELKSKQMVMLNFQLVDTATGEPIPDVEPYLGTRGHAVILDDTAERYIHVHAMDGMGSGSNVMFHTEFPVADVYKIWGQFQVDGKVIAAPFILKVQ
ncbi:hypothetical protein I6N90_24370 [Paenibacillus sp. GSMTC-2017]|uniref:hypothetical protein n=1 Tax=Paenibacillus sp. GSMTC-2017 TaxID=2794350 RepID=UPI0018D9C564|nr:hypothetical protein [Paenibacillus sp. GSMTC-2017]MBH5320925.1 hypothetical protein [Paenibacillus sp. GSMTC-2017]